MKKTKDKEEKEDNKERKIYCNRINSSYSSNWTDIHNIFKI